MFFLLQCWKHTELSCNDFIHDSKAVDSFLKTSEGGSKRPILSAQQLFLGTAGRLRMDSIYTELGHRLDSVLGIQATQTDQQTDV